MRLFNRSVQFVFLVFLGACLISCGGGGGSSSSSTSSSGTTTTGAISGTAAVGAPILGGTVNIYDSTGTLVGNTTTSATDGSYTVPTLTGVAPFTVEVIGNVGDSVGKYYAVVSSTGTANVNQISNGIASTLSSTGNPSDLTAGNTKTSSDISSKETGFLGALNTLLTSMGVSGSPVTASYSSALDGALDNLDVVVLADGSYELASSEGQAMPDILGTFNPDTTSVAANKVQAYAKGATPSSSDASNIPAPSSAVIATAASLEPLRAQLKACFSHAAASRATNSSLPTASPNWTIHADCQNLAYDNGSGSAFKHDSYYWLDNLSSNSTSIKSFCSNSNAYCLGYFGVMLLNSNYNNLDFLKPDHIRPVGVDAGGAPLWHVKFPVVYSTGSRGQFGDAIGSAYNVVRYDAGTGKFQFYGNQRDVQSTIQPSATLVKKGATNNYRVETGLNIYINPYNSRSLKNLRCTGGAPSCSVYPVSARITPVNPTTGMLPAGGVVMANKVNATPTLASGVGSNKTAPNVFNVCTYLNYENPSLVGVGYNASTSNANFCSGVIRMNYAEFTKNGAGQLVASSGAYPPIVAGRAAWVNNWNSDGSYNGTLGGSLVTTASAKRGEPYKFVITMSNGDTVKLINRLPYSTMTPTQAAKLDYPAFAAGTDTAFASYTGSSSGFNFSWNSLQSALIFGTAIYWNQGEVDSTSNVGPTATSNTIPCPNNSGNTAIAGTNYANDADSDMLNCTLAINWKSAAASAPDGGVLQLKARTFDGLFIQSQIKQF